MTERFTAYITKYALTTGIIETQVMACLDEDPGTVYNIENWGGYFRSPDWHRTRADAVTQAEKMRAAKIASLCQSIAKLERMTFGDTP